MAQTISRILLIAAGLVVAGFLLLVLVGIWARHEQETEELGFRGPSERYLASQAGFPNDPQGYRESLRKTPGRDDHTPQAGVAQEMPAMEE